MKTTAPIRAVIVCLAAFWTSDCVLGEDQIVANHESTAAPVVEDSRIRRVFVHRKYLDKFARDGLRLLPIDAGELENLIRTSRGSKDGPRLNAPWVRTGVLTGRLGDNGVLHGEAEFDVETSARSIDDGRPGRLSFDHDGISFRSGTWMASDGDFSPAVWGAIGQNSGAVPLQTAVVVSAAGKLKLEWSARGTVNEQGNLRFDMRLPQCRVKRLVLDVPKPLFLYSDDGVITQTTEVSSETSRFEVALRSDASFGFSIRGQTQPNVAPSETTVRQTVVYDVSKRGAAVEANFEIASRGAPDMTTTMVYGGDVHVYEVFLNGKPCDWSVKSEKEITRLSIRAESQGGKKPTDESKSATSVSVRAVVDEITGKPWRLPKLALENATLSRSTISVVVTSDFNVTAIDTRNVIQTAADAAPTDDGGWRFEFEEKPVGASIDLTLSPVFQDYALDVLSLVTLGERERISTTILDATKKNSATYAIAIPISNAWIVDTVESSPSGQISDWFVRRDGETDRLIVQFTEPITAKLPARLVLGGRKYGAAPPEMSASGFRLVDSTAVTVNKEELFARPAKDFNLISENTASISTEILDPAVFRESRIDSVDEKLLGLQKDEPILPIDVSSPTARLRLVGAPALSAQVEILAKVRDETNSAPSKWLDEEIQIACSPENAPVQEVYIEQTGDTKESIVWTLRGTNEHLKSEPVASPGATPLSSGVTPAKRVWRLVLPTMQSQPFVLRGRLTSPLNAQAELPLVAIRGAATSQCRVRIAARRAHAFTVDSNGARAIPPPADAGDEPPARFAFIYDPTDLLNSDSNQAPVSITISPHDTPIEFGATSISVRDARLHTAVAMNGSRRDIATVVLENTEEERVTFQLPRTPQFDSKSLSVALNGQPVVVHQIDNSRQKYEFQLPPARRASTISIEYATEGPALEWRQTMHMPHLDLSVPVPGWRWTLSLPTGFETTEAATAADSIGGRLLGPFAFVLGNRQEAFRSNGRNSALPPLAFTRNHSNDISGVANSDTPAPHEFDDHAPTPIFGGSATIVHAVTTQSLSVCAFFASAALAIVVASRSIFSLAVIGCAGAIAAILSPLPYATMASAVFLGFGTVAFVQLGRAILSSAARREVGGGVLRTALRIAVIGLAGFVTSAHAGQPLEELGGIPHDGSARETSSSHSEYVVITPVDDERNPIGDKVYVSDALFSQLARSSNESSRSAADWILRSADYSATLELSQNNLKTEGEWEARFELTVLRRDAIVSLPFEKSHADWGEFATLDGSRIALRWSDDLTACTLLVPEPGEYRLAFHFSPKLLIDDAQVYANVRIPPLPTARLTIQRSENDILLGSPHVDGAVSVNGRPGALVAAIDNSDLLRVYWPKSTEPSKAARPSIQTIQNVEIAPESIRVVARVEITPANDSPLEHMQFVIGDGFELIHRENEQETYSIETVFGDQQRFRIRFSKPLVAPTTVELHVSARRDEAIGRLSIPPISFQDVEMQGVRWGMNVDPRLTFDPPTSTAATVIGPDTIRQTWPVTPPQFAYVTPPETPLRFAAWPRPVVTRASESTTVMLNGDGAEIDFQADVAVQEGSCFQHRIEAPPDFTVTSVRVLENGEDQLVRWAAGPDGQVSVYFEEPIEKRHVVIVRGVWRAEIEHSGVAPVLRLIADDHETSILRLRRKPNVSANVTVDSKKITPTVNPSATHVDDPASAADDASVLMHEIRYESNKGVSIVVEQTSVVEHTSSMTKDGVSETSIEMANGAANEQTPSPPTLRVDSDPTIDAAAPRPADKTQPTILFVTNHWRTNGVVESEYIMRFDSQQNFELRLPAGSTLVGVEAIGAEVAVGAMQSNRISLTISPVTAATLLRVIHQPESGDVLRENGRRATVLLVASPPIFSGEVALPIAHSIWRIDGIGRFDWKFPGGDKEVSAFDAVIACLNAQKLGMEAASASFAAWPLESRRDWFLPWARRVHAQEKLARLLIAEPTATSADRDRFNQMIAEFEQFFEQKGLLAEYETIVRDTAANGIHATHAFTMLDGNDAPTWIVPASADMPFSLILRPHGVSMVHRASAAILLALLVAFVAPIASMKRRADATNANL